MGSASDRLRDLLRAPGWHSSSGASDRESAVLEEHSVRSKIKGAGTSYRSKNSCGAHRKDFQTFTVLEHLMNVSFHRTEFSFLPLPNTPRRRLHWA